MSQYPTSIPSFTTKQDGVDYPQASHINDPQAEIVAIATGLKSGLQHALTVSTGGLTVSTGNTVLGQNLSVAGPSTFAGAVTFSTTVTFAVFPLNPPRVRVGIAADFPVAGPFVGVNWVTHDYDSHGMHSTSANSSRITFVDSTGVYHIGASVDWNPNSSGSIIARILLNDSTANVVCAQAAEQPDAARLPQNLCADVRITSTTTYATLQVFQASGSTRSLTSTGSYVTAMWAHKVA